MTAISGIDFNGRFLAASPTGVHRVAQELVAALGRRDGAALAGLPMRIVAPRDIRGDPAFGALPVATGGMFTSQLWEQLSLPWRSRGHLILSLCNLGPIARRDAITMIHDAQVFLTPASYSFAFRAWYRLVLPAIGRRHRCILTVSEFSRQELARFGVARLDRIHVIPNGVDHILRTPSDPSVVARLGLSPGRFVVALANAQAHKNIALLLRAFADPALADLALVLVGTAGASAFTAKGNAAPNNAIFAGKVRDDELRGLLEAACCLAFPSTTEGFGLPPLEAMALGCPTVVAPCGALPEVCGDAALYCPPDDVAAWVAAIGRLGSDAAFREGRQAVSREHAAGFTWDRAAALLEAVIIDTLQARGHMG